MLNNIGVLRPNEPDHSVLNQLNILEQVGIAITDVVAVNYALVSISNPSIPLCTYDALRLLIPERLC